MRIVVMVFVIIALFLVFFVSSAAQAQRVGFITEVVTDMTARCAAR